MRVYGQSMVNQVIHSMVNLMMGPILFGVKFGNLRLVFEQLELSINGPLYAILLIQLNNSPSQR